MKGSRYNKTEAQQLGNISRVPCPGFKIRNLSTSRNSIRDARATRLATLPLVQTLCMVFPAAGVILGVYPAKDKG